MKRTDTLLLTFTSAVALSCGCLLTVNWPSNICSDLARDVCIVICSKFVLKNFLFLALLLYMCYTLVKDHVFPKANVN